MSKEIQYKEFNGDARIQIPALIKAGYKPATMADVIELRISGKLKNTYIDSVSAISYSKDGNIKVVSNSDLLKKINSESELRNGALVLEGGVYVSINAQEFTRKQLKNHVGKYLTKTQAKNNPIWQELVQDKSLLNDYVDLIFSESSSSENMGVFLDSESNFDRLRAVYTFGPEDGSDANAMCELDNGGNRFVGISVGDAKEKDLEGKLENDIWSAINSGIAFEHNGTFYVPTNAKNIKLK